MDTPSPSSKVLGGPLYAASPERINSQRTSKNYEVITSTTRVHTRENSVHEKVASFNSLSTLSKTSEKRHHDAALKRAMLGREEAESEMQRYREEVRKLKNVVEEGKQRERKVAERLESVMEKFMHSEENYGRTKLAWEKEKRRMKKENFKSQSVLVKIQAELKSARSAISVAQADLEREKSQGIATQKKESQVQQQLSNALVTVRQLQENLKKAEQERDALRSIAASEDVARIASEGLIPLPASSMEDEFSSPKKSGKYQEPTNLIRSDSKEELDELRMLLSWEKQHAKRADECIEFLEMECRLHCCVSRRAMPQSKKIYFELQSSSDISKTTPGAEALPEEQLIVNPISPEGIANVARNTLNRRSIVDPMLEFHDPFSSPNDSQEVPSCEVLATNYEITENNKLSSQTKSTSGDHCRSLKATPCDISLIKDPDVRVVTYMSEPSHDEKASFCPTVSREEALAQIRERRGRARSLVHATITPKRQIWGVRRDISAPASHGAYTRGRKAN
ncbi:hypothetical protein BGHDH14_bgh02355 [Blumeria hordei DH14]|uniref:Uncharacterized protein n=1 Tax=Blumeria graminis f. sp. hordei (strain DH14) TaxID=546991 RepID=N1JG97_BLUG1|nr:hypothetical protein BGHDH14_bgh02355 [Blumeria hordei DH14]